MRWGLLISGRQHKPKKLGLSVSCALSLVPLDAIVPRNDHPGVRLFSQKGYPLDVLSITTTRQVFHMMSAMTKVLYESLKCTGENWGRAVVEEDLHAANRCV